MKIETWDTEWGTVVVYGTHDTDLAVRSINDYFEYIYESEEDLSVDREEIEKWSHKLWADPFFANSEEEMWPEDSTTMDPEHPEVAAGNWVPVLTYNY